MSRKIKRHEIARDGNVSPTTDNLLRGCKRIILAGDLVAQPFHDNSAIIAKSKKREAMARRVIQTGGVITIDDARRMKRAREAEDAEKEQRAEKRRQTKWDKLLAADKERRIAQGLPVIPDHADPVLNPDFINWDELQRSEFYAEWFRTNQDGLNSEEGPLDELEWKLEDEDGVERDELGRGLGDRDEDPFY